MYGIVGGRPDMRVLITVSPWPSHFFPIVPLAWALMASGHSVRVACQPSLASTVERAGLTAVVTGEDVDLAQLARRDAEETPLARPSMDAWRATPDEAVAKVVRRFVTTSSAMADDTVEFARHWRPDLVVYEPVSYAGLLAADVLGVPAVQHMWGDDALRGYRHVEPSVIAPLWKRFGIAAARPSADLTVDPCPPTLRTPRDDGDRQPIRYIPYNGSATEPVWLRSPLARPRVAITCGTSLPSITHSLSFTESAARASIELGLDVIVTITPGQRELLGNLPAEVRTVDFLPLHLLLPSCAAIVHHGGPGTTLTAARCGVPQLILPALGNQFLNAQQVSASGAGSYVDTPEVSSETIGKALGALVEDSGYGQAARRLAGEMAEQPVPADVVGVVEGLVPVLKSHSSGVRERGAHVHGANGSNA